MTLAEALAVTTGGVRSALIMLGVMALISSRYTPRPTEIIDLYRWQTSRLWAIASITFSPVFALDQLHFQVPAALAGLMNMIATLLACAALIMTLAIRAMQRTVPMYRIRRAAAANASIVAMFVAAAWCIR